MGHAVATGQLRDVGEPHDILVVRDITGYRGPHLDQAREELDEISCPARQISLDRVGQLFPPCGFATGVTSSHCSGPRVMPSGLARSLAIERGGTGVGRPCQPLGSPKPQGGLLAEPSKGPRRRDLAEPERNRRRRAERGPPRF